MDPSKTTMRATTTEEAKKKKRAGLRKRAFPSAVVAFMMEWLGYEGVSSAAAVCKGWSAGCASEWLWRLQYTRKWAGYGPGKEKEGEGEGSTVVVATPPPPLPLPPCAESKAICVQGEITSWRVRFARRLAIDRNWRELADDASAGRFASRILSEHEDSVYCMCVWWERGLVINGSSDSTIHVWSLDSGACESVLEGHTSYVLCLAGDEAQDLVVSGSRDKTVRLWEVSSGQCLHVLRGHTGIVWTVALLSNKVIVSGGGQGEIKMWDGEQGGACTMSLTGGGTSTVRAVVSDGKRIISGDDAGDIGLFDMESGACTDILFHAPDEMFCLLLREDVLVAGCHDGKIRVWDDLSSGDRTPREFKEQGGAVYSLSWQEGVGTMRVVSSHEDGMRLWDFETGECVFFWASDVWLAAADLHRLVYVEGDDMKMLDLSSVAPQ
jgi:WD40 repeat protein